MNLFDAVPPTHLDRRCPRCRRIEPDKFRCVRCRASLATAEQWEWAYRWAEENVALLRVAFRRVRPDLAAVLSDAELVSECLPGIVRGLLGWFPGRGTKLTTYLANSVGFTARKTNAAVVPTIDPERLKRIAG